MPQSPSVPTGWQGLVLRSGLRKMSGALTLRVTASRSPEPWLVLCKSQISGLGWRGKDQEGSLQAGGPCQHLPQGAGPHLPGVPLLPACPVGLEILEDPVGGERIWRSPLFRSKCNTEESAYNAGDSGSIRGSGRFRACTPLQYSCLENPMDRGARVGYSPRGHEESDTTE